MVNKAFPKDSFPLPRIDQLVDFTAGHKRFSFLDTYSGYHQIAIYEPDRKVTSFTIPKGLYCYKVMLFGIEECEGNLSKNDHQDVRCFNRPNNGGLY